LLLTSQVTCLRESCMPETGTYSLGGGRRLARKRASSDPTNSRPACRVLHTRSLPPTAEKAYEMVNKPNIFGGNETQWAGSRERTSILRSRRSFFLDIPFYRTHLALRGALECNGLFSTAGSLLAAVPYSGASIGIVTDCPRHGRAQLHRPEI